MSPFVRGRVHIVSLLYCSLSLPKEFLELAPGSPSPDPDRTPTLPWCGDFPSPFSVRGFSWIPWEFTQGHPRALLCHRKRIRNKTGLSARRGPVPGPEQVCAGSRSTPLNYERPLRNGEVSFLYMRNVLTNIEFIDKYPYAGVLALRIAAQARLNRGVTVVSNPDLFESCFTYVVVSPTDRSPAV